VEPPDSEIWGESVMADMQTKLIAELRNMFQFDQSDLDFGIYRIMAMKRTEIAHFLESALPAQITEGLTELRELERSFTAQKRVEEIERNAAELNADIQRSRLAEEYNRLKAELAATVDVSDIERDIYNHLYEFFSRYYDEGDFISQRRYTDGGYAIPSEGEEVILHWANADQYYVKTSENFRDYSFKNEDGRVCRFKLVDAQTERDNNKAREKRLFQLRAENPFELDDRNLTIFVEYKAGDKKQEIYIADIVTALQNAGSAYMNASWLLDMRDGKTRLERELVRYTAKNTFDYFIHKDLAGFLNRELDFFIKNEVFYIDDVDEQGFAHTRAYITKAKVLRRIARKIITFLAQIETFQKMLWLKKKFVVETNYCITLDRIGEEFYPEIIANAAQLAEWREMYAIDEIQDDLVHVGHSDPLTVEFLRRNSNLVLDTRHFSADFKERLIASVDKLDEQTDGLMIHSDNFQAINFLSEKYSSAVKLIYIDPPYNTDASKILYKNGYKHSSWLSLMDSRLSSSRCLLTQTGLIEVAIDDFEFRHINCLLDLTYGIDNAISNIAILTNPKGRDQGFIAQAHDYTLMYALDKRYCTTNKFILSKGELKKKFSKSQGAQALRELPLKRTGSGKYREDRPYMFFPFIYHIESKTLNVIPKDEYKQIYQVGTNTFDDTFIEQLREKYKTEDYAFILPLSENGEYFRWRWGYNSCISGCESGVLFAKQVRNGCYAVYQYDFADDEQTPKSLWFGERYDASSKGTNILENIIPQNTFNFPKSIYTVIDNIIIGSDVTDIVLDFFAGSATTGHAIIELNRTSEDSARKYILVEMGEYFDTVTLPRMKKVIYSADWRDGKPLNRNTGVSHIMKYVVLESYEDALANIVLPESEAPNTLFREEYLLKYMLNSEASGTSLLPLEKLATPFDYQLKITRKNESKETVVDLPETFNYLIGLTVKKSHARTSSGATFAVGQYGALTAMLTDGDDYAFKAVEGTLPGSETALVIWRSLTDDIQKDNAVLDAYRARFGKYKKVFVNGDCNLENVLLIEEVMKRKMFEEV
jgi:adenine-specific DNA-methyltransferase